MAKAVIDMSMKKRSLELKERLDVPLKTPPSSGQWKLIELLLWTEPN